jgi:FMN-dependent NADH-azoreductase
VASQLVFARISPMSVPPYFIDGVTLAKKSLSRELSPQIASQLAQKQPPDKRITSRNLIKMTLG